MKNETIESAFRKLKVGKTKDFPFTSYTGIRSEATRQNKEARLLKKISDDEVAFRVSISKKKEGFCTVIRVK